MVPRVGIEPTYRGLEVRRSSIELPGHGMDSPPSSNISGLGRPGLEGLDFFF